VEYTGLFVQLSSALFARQIVAPNCRLTEGTCNVSGKVRLLSGA